MARVFLRMPDPDQARFFVQTAFSYGLSDLSNYQTRNQPNVVIAEVPASEIGPLRDSGVTVYPDFQFSIFPPGGTDGASDYWEPPTTEAPMLGGKNFLVDCVDIAGHERRARRQERGIRRNAVEPSSASSGGRANGCAHRSVTLGVRPMVSRERTRKTMN